MTINSIRTENKFKLKEIRLEEKSFPLIIQFGINYVNIPIISDFELKIPISEKMIIIEKLLEAHKLALANVKAGNITGRGFATNICTSDGYWSLGTNFNNTRNDISSVCGERSAILTSYNEALMRFSKQKKDTFDFKIKYICMAQSDELSMLKNSAVPCEDCLSWLNTNKYFDDNTLIFSFENDLNNNLNLKAAKLSDFLPCKEYKLSNIYDSDKIIKYSKYAIESMQKFNISENDILNLVETCAKRYKENSFTNISNQNISCSILTEQGIYSASKIDWTKRWFVEPLEFASFKAIEKEKGNCKIKAAAYFGDNISTDPIKNEKYFDSPISIKSLGRIRQKYASKDTLLILNLENVLRIITISEYLPKKFVQGYKIV